MQEETENKKSEAALREERVLEFWKENNIFAKTLTQSEGREEFIFYEGPPTANGKPGIHHLEARAFKDAIPRYKTMRGFHVRRKGGWDTHGLPVELQVEKKLGLNSKKAIEEYGIADFNKQCKESVWEYLDIWNKFTKRIGYWVDQEHPYITYHNTYIESVWNILKSVNDKKLLYKDYKVVPWCARCGTALSSHELAQGYEDVKDLSVTAKFIIKAGQKFKYYKSDKPYLHEFIGDTLVTKSNPDFATVVEARLLKDLNILAWTTTPWTLPGNVALAVGDNYSYVLATNTEKDFFAMGRWYFEKLKNEDTSWEIVGTTKGEYLVGLEYEPLYPYLKTELGKKGEDTSKAFKVYAADFVTTEDGTGVVHTAVMYGQDDFELGTKIGLPKFHTVDETGHFIKGTDFLEGRFVKDEAVAVDIIKDLAHRGLLFKKEKYEHSYPHCWRCKTPLIYYARDSWYIRMSDEKIKSQLIEENKTINWEPAHTRDGRFGEWLKDIKDWAISRERYWGTPLPIWQKTDGTIEVIGSLDELKQKTKKSGNTYFVMRHGQTGHNLKNRVSTVRNSGSYLTEEGQKKSAESAEILKGKDIELIIASPFNRTMETAKIVAGVLGLSDDQITTDDRLHEMSLPMYEGRTWDEYHADYPKTIENFNKAPIGNESYADVKRRMMSFIFEIEEKYQNKKILIITHGGPAWLLAAGAQMLDTEGTLELIRAAKDFHYFENSEVQLVPFIPFPHDEKYELDFHRPYLDHVKLVSEDGQEMTRVKEVMDVWFDSGAMPFAQDHYPFENKEWIDKKGFPADFISEAIDQTRGWFYTLHAVGVLMERGKAYKNVICLGHILDAAGKKMSKSLGNIVDPWIMMGKYGVDTLRLWMYSVNQPGESKNFDEKTVALLHQQVFGLLYNVLAFYELYRDKNLENEKYQESDNILDQWIVTRLYELTDIATKNLDTYKLLEPTRAIREFIDDLSTWYLRRSRDRIKNNDSSAKTTLYFVLKTLSKIVAPFTPFTAEDTWQKLKNENDEASVHLEKWPEHISNKMLQNGPTAPVDHVMGVISIMAITREIVTICLDARQKAGIKVRQPLSSLTLQGGLPTEYINIILEETNIKTIHYNPDQIEKIILDTHITPELHLEGQYRELVRAIQDMRKKQGLNPSDVITLVIETGIEGQNLLTVFKDDLLKTVGAKELKIAENQGTQIKTDELLFIISIL